MHEIYTGLNAKGRAAMTEFLRRHLKDETLLDRQEHFEADVDLDLNIGSFELSGRFTKHGNPIHTTFASDELETSLADD